MGKRIIAAFLCMVMLCSIVPGTLPEVKAGDTIDAFQVTLTTNDTVQAGSNITFSLAIKNTTAQELTTKWINHLFYVDPRDSQNNPGVDFGTLYDAGNNVVNVGDSVTFAAGETKNYTLRGTIPAAWSEKSQITVVVISGEEPNIYFGQADYPAQTPGGSGGSGVPDDAVNLEITLNPQFDTDRMEQGKSYPFTMAVRNTSGIDLTNVLCEVVLEYVVDPQNLAAYISLSEADFEGQGIGAYTVGSIKAGQTVTLSGTIKVPDNAEINNKVDAYNYYRIAAIASVDYDAEGVAAFGMKECRVTLAEGFTNVRESTAGDAAGSVNLGSSRDLFSYLFTSSELNSGNQLDVIWVVDNCSIDSIPPQDKAIIENKAGAKKIAMLLDIELWTAVNGTNDEQITNLPPNLARTITINIPEEYRANNRVFTVIRVHNGAADELPDLDNDPNTVTISTDKFSYYALAYEDQKPVFKERPKAAETGDSADMKGSFIICVLMMGVITAMVSLKKKKMI